MTNPVRGEVWEVHFEPAVGAEIRKTRPSVVLSVNSVGRLPLKIVVPITDWKASYAEYYWFVRLLPDAQNGLAKESGADAFQVKSLSIDRFVKKLGILTDDEVKAIASAIALSIGYKP